MRSHPRTASALAAACLLALAATARAEDKEITTDQQYIVKSIMVDTAEIETGKLALKTTSNPEVKAFAKMMVADHTTHRKELMAMAKAMKADIPEGVAQEDADGMAKLKKLEGKAFDAAYAKMMVEGHEKALKMNQKWEKEGANAKVRAAATKTAKAVSEHLAMAKKLAGES